MHPPIHMLVADDDADFLLLLQIAMEEAGLGIHCHTVQDGPEALQYLQGLGRFRDRNRYPFPSLLLLDLRLPKLSGFDVLRWVRSQPRLNELPVLVLTGSAIESESRLARELGANAYLVKPFAFDQLVQLVERLRTEWLQVPLAA